MNGPGGRWWATAAACAVGAALALPEWVPLRWSREDGPVEWTGFAAFAAAALVALVVAARSRADARAALAALAFGLVMFVAAGEEISWGQRVLDLETPAALVDGNRQDELNLHNVEGLQTKAVLAQLAVAGAGVLLPALVRRPWARAGFPLFAGYLTYRGSRVLVVLADGGPAGRNSEVAELLLALGLLVLISACALELRDGARRDPAAAVAHRAPA